MFSCQIIHFLIFMQGCRGTTLKSISHIRTTFHGCSKGTSVELTNRDPTSARLFSNLPQRITLFTYQVCLQISTNSWVYPFDFHTGMQTLVHVQDTACLSICLSKALNDLQTTASWEIGYCQLRHWNLDRGAGDRRIRYAVGLLTKPISYAMV